MSSFDMMLTTLKAATRYNDNDRSGQGDKNGDKNPRKKLGTKNSDPTEFNHNVDNKQTSQSNENGTSIDPKEKVERFKRNLQQMWQITSLRNAMGITRNSDNHSIDIDSKEPTTINGKCHANENKTENGGMNANEETSSQPIRVHIAVCCLIVDDLPHENIWKRWIESGGTSTKRHTSVQEGKETQRPIEASADLFIHAKCPEKITSHWVKSKLLTKSYKPNWNDVRIVQAMLATAGEALKEKTNANNKHATHILFCTESCIPITSLQDAAHALLFSGDDTILETEPNLNYSFVSAYNGTSSRCTRFDERSCWSKLVNAGIPHDAIWKALPGWCLLCRQHIQAILDMPSTYLEGDSLWPAFEDVWAPEEVFFPTALSLLGFLPSENVILQSVTHSKWKNPSDANPIEYDDRFNEGMIRTLREEEGCLFLRKMKYPMKVQTWERVVLGIRDSSSHSNNSGQVGRDSHNHNRRSEHQLSEHTRYSRKRHHDSNDYDERRSSRHESGYRATSQRTESSYYEPNRRSNYSSYRRRY